MALFKQVKKPVIHASAGAEVSSKRPSFAPKEAPCVVKCPLGNDVRGWMVPLAQHEAYGRTPEQAFETAWRQITEKNPFPAIAGRVCQHPCEAGCNRKDKEGAVGINLLERFIGDFGVANGLKFSPTTAQRREAVAIVGAGPAGLACAYQLRRHGYSVALFDAAPQAGGMMRYGIPRSVIPAEVLETEVANVLQFGVDVRLGCVVGKDVSLDDLRRDYKAVFFAIGLMKPAQLQPAVKEDGVLFIGELPQEVPAAPQETAELNQRVLNSVSLALAQGLSVAEAIDRHFQKQPAPSQTKPTPIAADKMKLAWYPELPPLHKSAQAGLKLEMTAAEAIAEAKRCMSCGMCMDCETCWMYCTTNCFVRLPKGEHYKIKLDLCNGCNKCFEACPCGYIEMN